MTTQIVDANGNELAMFQELDEAETRKAMSRFGQYRVDKITVRINSERNRRDLTVADLIEGGLEVEGKTVVITVLPPLLAQSSIAKNEKP